jgi:serine/threonine protein kinase
MKFAPGQTLLDAFEVVEAVVSHGQKETYHGRDLADGSSVVLRIFVNPEEEGLKERFNTDVLKLARVNDDNTVAVRHFGFIDGVMPCLVLSETIGPTLTDYIKEKGPLDWPHAISLVGRVLDGLGALHAQGLFHRDVCPNAIQLIHGDKTMPLITDFGVGQKESPYETKLQHGWVAGDPGFMSPEQLYGLALDERSDVYSAALVLYSCVSGQSMAVKSARDALEQRVMNRLPALSGPDHKMKVPVVLRDLLTGALEPDPAKRPQSAWDFGENLRDLARSTGHASTTRSLRRQNRSSKRVSVTSSRPAKGWRPPNWAQSRNTEGEPQKRPVSARIKTIGPDDILSSTPAGAVSRPSVEAPPLPPLPSEDFTELLDADIVSVKVAEEFDADIISEELMGGAPAETHAPEAFQIMEPEAEAEALFELDDEQEIDEFVVPPSVLAATEPTQPPSPLPPPAMPPEEVTPPAAAPTPETNNQEFSEQNPAYAYSVRNENERAHAVIVARIPMKKLRLPSEIRWLREQIGQNSHALTVGQNMWVGTIITDSKEEAEELAGQAKTMMAERYGADFRAEWTPVAEDFEVNSGNVLPSVVEGLIHYLSHG